MVNFGVKCFLMVGLFAGVASAVSALTEQQGEALSLALWHCLGRYAQGSNSYARLSRCVALKLFLKGFILNLCLRC